MKDGFVYILSNKHRTTIYIGVTNDIEQRILMHKSGLGSLFTKKYNLTDLLYFERISGIHNAINREKQLKNWHKEWKWNLIKEENPELKDLAADWFTDQQIEECRKTKDNRETADDRVGGDPETSSG
ncbi:MAG: GIY-YIG nuclease family protein [Bacteroidia bacterium]